MAWGAAQARALRVLASVTRRDPSRWFTPSPGLAAFWGDRSLRIAVVAANRTGKTRHAIERLAREMRTRPGTRYRIVAPTARQGIRIHAAYLAAALGDFLADGSSYSKRTGFNAGNVAYARNGSSCEITSYEQEPDAHAGSSLHGVLLDEPPPPGHYEEALARVFDVDGWVWVTLTAVGRPVKWLREIVEDGVRDGDWTLHRVPLSTTTCPWYSADQVARRLREARRAPWSYAQRIEGAWEGVSDDRRFTGLAEGSILPLTVGPRQGWPVPGRAVHLALSADHGDGSGHAVWVLYGYQVSGARRAGDGPRRVHVRAIAEWTNDRRHSVETEAAAVDGMVRAAGFTLGDIEWAVGDTNALSKSTTARTLNEAFEAAFARLGGRFAVRPARKGPDSVEGGIAIVNGLLDDGGLVVSEACPSVEAALRHWAGKDDDLKHAADSLRYGVVAIADEVGGDRGALAA